MAALELDSCHVCRREYVSPNGGICGACGRPTCLACFARLVDLDETCQNGTQCHQCAAASPAGHGG